MNNYSHIPVLRDEATPAAPDPSKTYEPTERERPAVKKQLDRFMARTPAPRLKVQKKAGVFETSLDHPDRMIGWLLFAEALGTCDTDFVNGLMNQVLNA
ncbi:MAG: hypothetical protein B7Z81_01210, partial [Acidocella sp. 20-61-6]